MPIKILKDLIAFKTENPPGDEYRVINYVKKLFSKNKIKFKQYSKVKGRENIIGSIGKGKPTLLIACHADTVPAGEGWKTNPFKAVVKNGRVYGRGACDDKGPMAAMLKAALELKKVEDQLKGTFLIGVLADEEMGSELGLHYLVDKKIIKPDYAIIPDISYSMKKIDIAEKGVLRLELISEGRSAHGSTPKEGVNAITNLNEVLTSIKDYTLKHKKHRLLSKPTINIGMVEGGTAPNMVPALARATLDIRFLPSQNSRGIIKEIKSIIDKKSKKNTSIRIKIKKGLEIRPTELSPNNRLVKTIQKTTKRVLGFKPATLGLSGATDAKPLIMKGIPAVGYSCGEHNQAHVPNESIKIKELEQFSRVLVEIVKDILS